MTERAKAEPGKVTRFLITAAACVVVIAGMRAAASLLSQVLLAAFLAVICFPPLAWLQRKGVPTPLALLIVVVVGVTAVVLAVALIGTSVADFTRSLPDYQRALLEQTRDLVAWLEDKGIDLSAAIEQPGLDTRRLLSFASTLLGTMGSLSSNAAVILLIFFFILVEAAILPDKMRAIPGFTRDQEGRLGRVLENIRHYLAIKTQMSVLTGGLVTILLLVLKVDYPFLWGILAFLLNYVPNIGSIIAAIPAVLLALVQLGFGPAAFAAVGYLVINVGVGNLLEPRLMGRGLGLSTLVVFLSLLFWGWVLGPVGMLLSVPLTMIVKIALDSTEETRWIAILLDSSAPRPGDDGS
jgi:predicted PurR-regulated permease PerM